MNKSEILNIIRNLKSPYSFLKQIEQYEDAKRIILAQIEEKLDQYTPDKAEVDEFTKQNIDSCDKCVYKKIANDEGLISIDSEVIKEMIRPEKPKRLSVEKLLEIIHNKLLRVKMGDNISKIPKEIAQALKDKEDELYED